MAGRKLWGALVLATMGMCGAVNGRSAYSSLVPSTDFVLTSSVEFPTDKAAQPDVFIEGDAAFFVIPDSDCDQPDGDVPFFDGESTSVPVFPIAADSDSNAISFDLVSNGRPYTRLLCYNHHFK